MEGLTRVLSRRLYDMFRAPFYYTQPRFHVSFAYREPSPDESRSDLIQEGTRLAHDLNKRLSTSLRAYRPLPVHSVGVQVGKHVEWLALPSKLHY